MINILMVIHLNRDNSNIWGYRIIRKRIECLLKGWIILLKGKLNLIRIFIRIWNMKRNLRRILRHRELSRMLMRVQRDQIR